MVDRNVVIKHQHQILINRPVEEVFRYMDDVSREHEWQPNIAEAAKDPPGETQVGTRKRYVSLFMGKRIQNTYVTRVFERNRHVVYETTPDSVLQARAELRWETEAGGTRVTMGFQGKVGGVLRFVPRSLLDATYKNELASTLKLLKERLESEG
jgi:carbon monoxide dehydrogenase subunit G